MSLDYWAFDPSVCKFPAPRISILPSILDYAVSPNGNQPSLNEGICYFSRGRYALGEAYRLAGLDKQSALLAPAYHCVTMLDPALVLKAEVQLYPLKSDLTPDLGSLDYLYAKSIKPVKALLATHFFGFVQDFTWLKQWCNDKKVVLIEDCSHVLFTERYQAKGAGLYGKFVASSPYKFFPSTDGGLLYAPEAKLLDGVKTESAGLLAELRSIKSIIEKFRLPKVSTDDIERIGQQLESIAIGGPTSGIDQRIERSAQSTQYSLSSAQTASLRSSRRVIGQSSISGNVTRRQENYRHWVEALSDTPNCHVLYPKISSDIVPYMLPLYLDSPMPHFYWLKQLGFPVWRWDEMAISNCQVATDYRLHLLHLPCHQSLSKEEMAWMLTVVRKVLTIPVDGIQ